MLDGLGEFVFEMLTISRQDPGHGMSLEILPQAFDRVEIRAVGRQEHRLNMMPVQALGLVPTGLVQKQTAPAPQAEELKEKATKQEIQKERLGPAAAPMMNTDLYPPQKPMRGQQQLPEGADEVIEQYVYMESDRSVRNELTSYRREILEQLELFREAQKK